ncbi:MAG: DMT family transporter [Solirubrobacterales bacterium]
MSASVQIGLVLALATALASILGFLYKHRGAVEAPDVEWRRPVHSSLVLFRSRWYTLGVLIAMAGWGLHVGALALAPISLVQATIAGGLVMLTAIAEPLFGHRVSRREWIGVGLAAAGLAFLAATLDGGAEEAHSGYASGTLASFVAAAAGLGLAVGIAGRSGQRAGVLLGASAGLLWAASDTSIKALSGHLDEGAAAVLASPLALVVLLASLLGMLVSARSLQIGPPVAVIAVTSVAANVTTILAGPVVFDDPLPEDTLGLMVRLLAFLLVISAAALTPPPLEAEAELPGLARAPVD